MAIDDQITILRQKIKELESELDEIRSTHVSISEHEKVKSDLIAARQEAIEANQSKTMFLANMSHEIRTPMNSIIGIYNVLSQTSLTDEQKEFLEIINISSHNLLAIINDILDLSKIEAGQLKLEYKPYCLHDEVQQVIKLLSLKAKGKGIELYSVIESSVPACVVGDAGRLKQVLINLANNAIKFTNQGHVAVSVETLAPADIHSPAQKEFIPDLVINEGNLTRERVILKFEVQDTGIGISEEEQKNLFHEFAQLDNPLIRKFEGTGLGLSISKNLMKLMNGKIGVISKKGEGSTFWFSLVLDRGTDEEILKQQAPPRREKMSRPLSVLIVEDNLLNQKFARTSLQRVGHSVEIAENGKIAVEKYKKQHFDLILMDIAMPIMDGIEATHVIRRLEEEKRTSSPDVRRIRIVAVTAHVMVTDREKCLAAGMDDYLAKPYRPQDLLNIIESLDLG